MSLDLTDHLTRMRHGDLDAGWTAFSVLWNQRTDPADPQWADAMRAWIDGLFADPEVIKRATAQPRLFVNLIGAARDLIMDATLGSAGYTDDWLDGNLARLDPLGAAAVAADIVATSWTEPATFGPRLRTFVLRKLGGKGLNNADGGLAARFINMAWNDGDYDLICDLINDGVDTAAPAYYGVAKLGERDGAWCGYIQPIEHVLGRYLRLAEGDISLTTPAPGGVALDDELVAFGRRAAPGQNLDRQRLIALGRDKLAGATRILKTLSARRSALVLTSFKAVRESPLLAEFTRNPGSIWGFEDVRMPYVQAAHATPKGQRPVRMWELWEMVGALVNKGWYEAILKDPHRHIPELMDKARKDLGNKQLSALAEYIGRNTAEYVKEFEIQCSQYLWSLVELAPRAKYPTAKARGHKMSAYLGSFGCNAGLWWAKRQGQPVYYCLDGVRLADVVDYKRLKTSRINTFITTRGERYIEGITLAEIREILLRWDELKDTVRFTRRGEFVQISEIEQLRARMLAADKDAGARLAPDRSVFTDELAKLGPDVLADAANEVVLRVVAQAYLLRTAASAWSPLVLKRYLTSKGCRVLFEEGLLPYGFDEKYLAMVGTEDPDERKRYAAELITQISDTSSGTPVVCDSLRVPLVAAIKRFSGLI